MNTSRIVATFTAVFTLAAISINSPVVAEEISAEERFELQIMWEEHLEERLVSAFEVLGLKTVVRVSVQLDWTAEKREAIRLDTPVVISHLETIKEEFSPGDATASDLSKETTPGKRAITSESVRNFDAPREVTEHVTPSGIVRHLSVAAFIEGDLRPIYDELGKKTGEFEYHPHSQERIESYAQFIRAALGKRLDVRDLFVMDHPFGRTRNSRR